MKISMDDSQQAGEAAAIRLTAAQHVQQLARDINEYNQLAMFCGVATMESAVPTVQLMLGNSARTVLFISAALLLPALAEHGRRLQVKLADNGIDTDELLADVSNSLQVLARQKGG